MAGASEGATRGRSARQQRIITGVLAAAVAVGATLWLPSPLFFVCVVSLLAATAAEYARLVRHWTPSAPLGVLPPLVALASVGWFVVQRYTVHPLDSLETALLPVAVLVLGPALSILWSKTRVPEAGIAIGLMSFGLAYFTLATLCLYWLHALDPWWVIALLLLVAIGDSVAYFAGSAFGRRRLAPMVSPNKTWEGSIAGLLGSIVALALWSQWYLGTVEPQLLVLGALTAVAGQIGDLLESLIKRGVGVKDSSSLLPGHGGLYDRLDALLLAAPVFLLGLVALDLIP